MEDFPGINWPFSATFVDILPIVGTLVSWRHLSDNTDVNRRFCGPALILFNFLNVFLKYCLKLMFSMETSWKMIKKDTPQQYSEKCGGWALKDLTYLEQIPNAFSVWSELSDLLPTCKSMVLNSGDLFYGHTLMQKLITFVHLSLIFTIFWRFFETFHFCWQNSQLICDS